MRKAYLLTAAAALLSYGALAFFKAEADTTDPSMFKKGTAPAKMVAARHEFLNNNLRGALTLYREVLEADPENATAMYRLSECHYGLKSYKLAVEYFDKSIAIDPNVSENKDFFRAQIHHSVGELEEALESYKTFLTVSKNAKTLEYELCKEGIEQCMYAKAAMAHPYPVKSTNPGRGINSRYDDYTPSVTADGKMMVFTTRRGDVAGGEAAIDKGSDYKFFEDIYYSEWDAQAGEWTKAFPVEGKINSEFYDAVLSLSPDGNTMYVYKNNAGSAGDIFISLKDSGGQWGEPTKLSKPINTSYFESSITMTADGKTIYFISERPGGKGQGDVYTAKQQGKGWSNPENLGGAVNTFLDEKFVFVHPGGTSLFFASNGHQTMGSYDLFRTDLVNGKWSVPINLGYPINSVNEESTFSLTSDYTKLFIAAEYADSYGERDIYEFNIAGHPIISGQPQGLWRETEIIVKNGSKRVGGAEVQVKSAYGKVLFKQKADDRGRVILILPTDAQYEFLASEKGGSGTVNVKIAAAEGATTPQVIELSLAP